MADEAISQLETLTSKTSSTKTLFRATHESVDIITPWVGTTSDNRALQNVMVSLRAEMKGFAGSITQSYDNAQSAYEFAKRAENMCKSMIDPTNTDEEIQGLVMEMRQITQKAHEDTANTANNFCANRVGFHNIVANIPDARESMDREHGQIKEQKDKAKQRAESWGRRINKFRNRKKKNIASDLITMPYVAFAKSRQSSWEGKARDLETKIYKFGNAIQSIQDAELRVADLAIKMYALADYWLSMDTVLEEIHGRVRELRKSSTLRIKIKCLAADWNQLGLEYRAYKAELARLSDLNPTIRTLMQGEAESEGNHMKQTHKNYSINLETNKQGSKDYPPKSSSESSGAHDCSTISFKPDAINAIVSRMATSAEEMATGWYNIQVAILGTGHSKALLEHAHLEGINNGFRLYLTDIIAVLQLCLKFSSHWRPIAITSDEAELIDLMVELVPTAQECSQKARDLVSMHQRSIQYYFDHISEFDSVPSGPRLSGEEKPTIQFRQTCKDLEKGVEDLATFFEEQLKEYSRQWNAVKNLGKAAPVKEANQFAKEWSNTQGSLMAAKVKTIRIRDDNFPDHAPRQSQGRAL